jgi:hypothetical protein
MTTLHPGLFAREDLAPSQRDEMFTLLAEHFDGVTRGQFERDLEDKNWVVQIRREDRLVGFSTLAVEEIDFEGEMITAVYSGDTIVAPEAWNSPALSRAWIAAVNHLRGAWPGRRCFWLLLTSGFRTYRFLPVFWREFHPCHRTIIPPDQQRLLHHLATRRYGACYDANTGLVRFPQPQMLRSALGAVSDGRETNPHIAYFLARNPDHGHGDELVCLTEISDANLTAAGRRMIAPLP